MKSLLVTAPSPSFGRLGSLFFPENCSTSVPGCRTRIRRRHQAAICSAHSSQHPMRVLFELGLPFGRCSFGCSAMAFDYPLSENAGSEKHNKDEGELSWTKGHDRKLTTKVMELSKRRQLNEVFELIESAKAADKKLNRKTMNAVLEACVHCRNVFRAMQVFNGMAEPGACGVDEVTYGTLIKGLGQAGMLDRAFEIIESLEAGRAPGGVKLSVVHLNTLINACANAGDAKRARAALSRYQSVLKDKGPSLVTYNMLVKGYARSDNPLEAIKVREEMVLRGVQPNKLTLNSLILAGVRGHDINMAFEILEEMKEAGKLNAEIAPDVVTYTILLKALAEDGDLEGVIKIVSEMKATETCVLDRVGYTSIIDACISAGSPSDAMCFFLEMQELAKEDCQLKPRTHAFLALMRAFSEKGDVSAVTALQSKMVSEASGHVWPEDRLEAEELLIEAAVNSQQWDLARKVIKDLVKLDQQLHLSQRGYMAIVRLQAMTGFADNLLSPWIIRDQVSLSAPLSGIVPHLTSLAGAHSLDKCFLQDEQVLSVVKCIGTLDVEECNQKDVPLKDVMRGPPAALPSSLPLSAAVQAVLEPGVRVVAVVDSSGNGTVSYVAKDKLLRYLSGDPARVAGSSSC